jgi:hypothetical protein
MPTSSFYNDNIYRCYPFVAAYNESARDADIYRRIVSVKIFVYSSAVFTKFPLAELVKWETVGTNYRITFSVFNLDENGDKTIDKSAVITFPKNAPRFARVDSGKATDEIFIQLVVGDLPESTPDYTGSIRLEPTCVIWYQHRGVDSVYVVNKFRPRMKLSNNFTYVEGYKPIYNNPDYDDLLWWQGQDNLRFVPANKDIPEPLIFSEGYNCNIYDIGMQSTLVFMPEPGAGAGVVATEISQGRLDTDTGLNIIEQSPDGGVKYRIDGLPKNENVIYSIAGVPGPNVEINAADGVLVTPINNLHWITVEIAALGEGIGC